MKTLKFKKIITIIICIYIFLMMTLSSGYGILHINHHCIGAACSICEVMHLSKQTFKLLSSGNTVVTQAVLILIVVLGSFQLVVVPRKAISLFSLKVRLDN